MILETARFINKKFEKGQFHKMLESRGTLSPSKFRSACVTDYFLRDETKIDEFKNVVEGNKSVFNVTEITKYFDKVKDYKTRTFTHSTFYQGLEICQVVKGHF